MAHSMQDARTGNLIYSQQATLGNPVVEVYSTARVITTEGIKYDNEKLRLDLLPFDALMEVAEVYSMGAKKYSDRNWEKGLSYMRIVGALLRHLFAWILGEERAADDKQRHLASVVWCGLALLTYELRGMKEFDDRVVK